MTTSPSQGSGEDSHARERRLEKDEKILYIVGMQRRSRQHDCIQDPTRTRAGEQGRCFTATRIASPTAAAQLMIVSRQAHTASARSSCDRCRKRKLPCLSLASGCINQQSLQTNRSRLLSEVTASSAATCRCRTLGLTPRSPWATRAPLCRTSSSARAAGECRRAPFAASACVSASSCWASSARTSATECRPPCHRRS